MVVKINIHKIIMIITPPPFDFRPKKIIDHKELKTSWIQNSVKANTTPGVTSPFCQTITADIAISRYRMVQTGPNSQLGGVKEGLLRFAYQSGTASRVKSEPIKAAEKVTAKQTISFITMVSFIIVFYIHFVYLTIQYMNQRRESLPCLPCEALTFRAKRGAQSNGLASGND